jgi:hypothetical protein
MLRSGDPSRGVVLIGDIAGIATAVAVLIAAGGLFAQSRARKFGLAQVYIERYWVVDEYFLPARRPEPTSADARRYLRLCEDEFDAAQQGWIDVAVWRTWHSGIREQVHELNLDVSAYDHLRVCMAGAAGHEATSCPGLGKPGLRRRLTWWIERIV